MQYSFRFGLQRSAGLQVQCSFVEIGADFRALHVESRLPDARRRSGGNPEFAGRDLRFTV
jgi:hypothetical protein